MLLEKNRQNVPKNLEFVEIAIWQSPDTKIVIGFDS